MELKGLLQYLVNQLKKGVGIELVVLEVCCLPCLSVLLPLNCMGLKPNIIDMQELIQQMANVQYTENMTEEQVDAMAGSETLRQQASLFGATRNYKVVTCEEHASFSAAY